LFDILPFRLAVASDAIYQDNGVLLSTNVNIAGRLSAARPRPGKVLVATQSSLALPQMHIDRDAGFASDATAASPSPHVLPRPDYRNHLGSCIDRLSENSAALSVGRVVFLSDQRKVVVRPALVTASIRSDERLIFLIFLTVTDASGGS
jgi:hypothetical protein